MTDHGGELAVSLGEQVVAALADLIPPGTRCAVVDAPLHSNVGDSAIWLGQRALLNRLRAEVCYACDQASYSARHLAARLPHGPILLHGGGSLGDLWETSQLLRERVIRDFPQRQIVQLPQSVHFRGKMNLDRARAVFDAHPQLTLLLRDRQSLAIAQTEFAAGGVLCPDPAFLLPDVPLAQQPQHDLVWLAREDQESGRHIPTFDPATAARRFDWTTTEADGPWLLARDASLRRRWRALRGVNDDGPEAAELCQAYDELARLQVLRGCRLLASGRVVITDRLHGHILSLLLSLPHVVVADRHGKLRGFWETWTSGWERATWACSEREAVERAQHMLTSGVTGSRGTVASADDRSGRLC